jgi:hypothetical protein
VTAPHPDRLRIALADLNSISDVAHALAQERQETGQIVRSVDGQLFRDPYIVRVLETGLGVTYARLFTQARGYGRIPESWVPPTHRDLHDFLRDRRDTYDAHTDATAKPLHRRSVSVAEGDPWMVIGYPDALTAGQLTELVELADELVAIIQAELARL